MRQCRIGVLIYFRQRERRRTHHQINNRLIGGIDFLQRGLIGHAGRQLTRGLRNCSLYILRRRIDVPTQIELQRDLRITECAGGTDGIQTGDGGKLSLERSGNRRSHRFRTRARQLRGNLDGWVIDVREVTYRQRAVTDKAEQHDAGHDERRGDRALNKEFRHSS